MAWELHDIKVLYLLLTVFQTFEDRNNKFTHHSFHWLKIRSPSSFPHISLLQSSHHPQEEWCPEHEARLGHVKGLQLSDWSAEMRVGNEGLKHVATGLVFICGLGDSTAYLFLILSSEAGMAPKALNCHSIFCFWPGLAQRLSKRFLCFQRGFTPKHSLLCFFISVWKSCILNSSAFGFKCL